MIPLTLWLWSIFLGLLFWGTSSLRHLLLQSNAYDLGLFDQWAWLLATGEAPISSMEGVHVLADHAAWLFPLIALPYKAIATTQWLLLSQSFALTLTAIPLWVLSRKTGLSLKHSWLVCYLWWLQPVVFNTNLFDFHPEVWAMPALAGCFIALREGKLLPWFAMILVLLGCRDGLALIVIGLGIGAALQRRWQMACMAWLMGFGWLFFLSYWFYPLLKGEGVRAASRYTYLGNSFSEIALNITSNPIIAFKSVLTLDALGYIILITAGLLPFWRRASLTTIATAAPLIISNLISASNSQRTLIHHYNLPVALIFVVAAVNGIAVDPHQKFPWRKLAWVSLTWALLAKPWFFSGPYLERRALIGSAQLAIKSINQTDSVLTTSYLVPHLSHRKQIEFPKLKASSIDIDRFDVLLLNPLDPGWASNTITQNELITKAINDGWECSSFKAKGLKFCRNTEPNHNTNMSLKDINDAYKNQTATPTN